MVLDLSHKISSPCVVNKFLIFSEAWNFISKFIRAATEPCFEPDNLIHTFTLFDLWPVLILYRLDINKQNVPATANHAIF